MFLIIHLLFDQNVNLFNVSTFFQPTKNVVHYSTMQEIWRVLALREKNIGCVDMGSRGVNMFTLTIVVGPIRNSHCPLVIGTFIKDRMASYFQGYMDNVSETRHWFIKTWKRISIFIRSAVQMTTQIIKIIYFI